TDCCSACSKLCPAPAAVPASDRLHPASCTRKQNFRPDNEQSAHSACAFPPAHLCGIRSNRTAPARDQTSPHKTLVPDALRTSQIRCDPASRASVAYRCTVFPARSLAHAPFAPSLSPQKGGWPKPLRLPPPFHAGNGASSVGTSTPSFTVCVRSFAR